MQVQPEKKIAVLIPAYNAEKIIHKAIDSLNLNKEPHDIIVIDDGSPTVLADHIPAQANLVIIRAEKNGGITKALNLGAQYILDNGYTYLARLDADDTASPDRLTLQREFMEANPDIALCGSWGKVVSEEDNSVLFYLNHPIEHEEIMQKLYYNSQFLHPSLIIRTEVLKEVGLFSEAYPSAEDYELIRRIGKKYKLANIGKYLINYTSSSGGISQKKRRQQLMTRLKIQLDYKNYASLHFYLGVIKTFLLLALPVELITAIKMRKKAYKKSSV